MKAGPGDSDKIRLPELPVFKRFSLALRQEYATADEILSVIDRTVSRIKDVLDREAEIRRRADAEEFPDEVSAFDDEESELFPEEMVEPEELDALLEPEPEPQPVAEAEREQEPEPEPEEDGRELFVESPESIAEDQKFQEQSLTADEEIESLLAEPDVDAIFPLEEEGVESLIPDEEEVTTLIRPDSDEPAGRTSKAKSAAKRKPKKKTSQPEIVRVSKHGKPLGLSKVKKNVKSSKRPAQAAKRKGTPKGRSRSR